MPGNFQVICGSMIGKNCRSPASTEIPGVNVAGMKWLPKKDLLALGIVELNFAKKQCRKIPVQHQNIIPSILAREIVFQKWLKS